MTVGRKQRLSAVSQLQGVLTVLESSAPASTLLKVVREKVTDALAILVEQDPLTKRIAFVLLAIQESTEVRMVTVRGKEHERILVKDRPLYEWAIKQVHEIGKH